MDNDKNNSSIKDLLTDLTNIQLKIKSTTLFDIDKDIILEKIRLIYQDVLIANKTEINLQINEVSDLKTEPIIEEIPSLNNEQNIIVDEELKKQEIIDNTIVEPTLFKETTENKNNDNKKIKENTQTTISDLFVQNSNESKSQTLLNTLNTNQQKKYLSKTNNIKSVISINDRLLFTKELFKNNHDQYNNAIDKLNTLQNIEEAKDFLKTVAYNMETEVFENFIEIISRRYN